MIQVLPARKSFGGELGEAIGGGINAFAKAYGEQQKKKELAGALQGLGDVYNNPELNEQQRLIEVYRRLQGNPELASRMGQQLSGLGQKNISSAASAAEDRQRYDVIKKNFGEQAADLYKAAPEGGKTNFLDMLLESRQRGMDVNDLLGQQPQGPGMMGRHVPEQPSEIPEMTPEKGGIKAIDYDKGLLPKERVKRQEERYAKNLPLYQESQKKLQGLESEKDSLAILEELSPKIGAMQRLNINPTSGELLIPGLASPEAQRFVKTVNDFTVKAKDTFGARISNFELDRFMKRLPTLANSEEGRGQIIRQMQIINDINGAREEALQNVIEEHGGIRNIDYDRAEALADKHAKPKIESLRKEFKSIDSRLEKQYEQKIKEKRQKAPKGFILMEFEGKTGYVPEKEVKKAIKEGAKIL